MRTTLHFLTFSILLSAICLSQENAPIAAKEAWLGLGVSKPDEVTATQLPLLPPGIGFVVSELTKSGPAERAGIRKNDLLWKMEEQMLVNEGQLATLLRLSAPGDEVTVSLFREGKSMNLKVVLGEAKSGDAELIRNKLKDSVIRLDDGAVRIVDLKDKKAVVTDERGRAEVVRLSQGDLIRIVGTDRKVIFEGLIRGDFELSTVPKTWRRQVSAMRRGLDHALSVTPAPQRQPRARIVLPPAEE
jgi:hypothetical protein